MPNSSAKDTIYLTFDDNRLLPVLFGDHDVNLDFIEKSLGVVTASRGNILSISGEDEAVQQAKAVLELLYKKLEQNRMRGSTEDVGAIIRMVAHGEGQTEERLQQADENQELQIRTRKNTIVPYSNIQADYIRALKQHELTFAVGPAGTGKTYLAVAMAVSMFVERKVDRIIFSRPAVEAGESLGFLPGDLKEKVDPYMRPIYDALMDMLPPDKLQLHMDHNEIEIAPLAFMRGRTLSNAFVVLDEAQNTTPTQMKMFLTRFGQHSRMAIAGDLSQTDLPMKMKSGLRDALEKVESIPEIGVVHFSNADVVRHPLAAKIIDAYDAADKGDRS